MIDSKCRSSEKPGLSVVKRSFTRAKLSSNSSFDGESITSIESAPEPIPLLGPCSSSEEKLSFLRSRGRIKNHGPYLRSPLKRIRSRQSDYTLRDSQSVQQNFTDSGLLSEKAQSRVRCVVKKCPKSPISPDRFIPIREFGDSPSTPFRVNKVPDKLSPDEKLLRRRSPKVDPFMSTPPRSTAVTFQTNERIHSPHYGPHLVNDSAIARIRSPHISNGLLREISSGTIWNIVGTTGMLDRSSLEIPDGAGGLLGSGTTAPMYRAKFLPHVTSSEHREKHESRIALALDIDPSSRLLKTCKLWPLPESSLSPSSPDYERFSACVWKDNAWRKVERDHWSANDTKEGNGRIVPVRPFRVLDAPLLRDDFYCSTLAYSPTSGSLAVGLGSHVYLWSEGGLQFSPFGNQHPSNYVMSLSFSSENGGKSILAVGRHAGLLSLWSVFDSSIRFEISHSSSITCVAFKPTKSRRLSERFPSVEVDVEDLAVGDGMGNIWYYSIEWPDHNIRENLDWDGAITLLAKISAHTQQICGLAWSPDDIYLASGGNDNACLLFELREIIQSREAECDSDCCSSRQALKRQCQSAFACLSASNAKRAFNRHHLMSHLIPAWAQSNPKPVSTSLLNHTGCLITGAGRTVLVPPNRQKHRLLHSAAVKAIAFAPWQPSLLATGGGSNDRAIHFFHTLSGACLATINVYAQVTSLIWSKTRREIVATFGYAQPEHPYRIAVFAWPSCEQITAIPWGPHGRSWDSFDNVSNIDCGRALCAVSYSGRPRYPMARYIPSRAEESEEAHDRPNQTGHERNGLSQRTIGPEFVRPRAKEGGMWCSRTIEEGCIIIASSDQSVKFHEVWSGPRKSRTAAWGPLGASEILEGLEGFEKAGREIIR